MHCAVFNAVSVVSIPVLHKISCAGRPAGAARLPSQRRAMLTTSRPCIFSKIFSTDHNHGAESVCSMGQAFGFLSNKEVAVALWTKRPDADIIGPSVTF